MPRLGIIYNIRIWNWIIFISLFNYYIISTFKVLHSYVNIDIGITRSISW